MSPDRAHVSAAMPHDSQHAPCSELLQYTIYEGLSYATTPL